MDWRELEWQDKDIQDVTVLKGVDWQKVASAPGGNRRHSTADKHVNPTANKYMPNTPEEERLPTKRNETSKQVKEG